MAKKYRIKKKVLHIGIVAIIIILIISFIGVKLYSTAKYKKSYEYKLVNIGYTIEQANELEKNANTKDLDKILTLSRNENIIAFLKEKYYISNNLERYLAYQEKNKDKTTSDIVAIVNVNRDYEFYEHDIDTDTTKNELLLVNKYYKLNSEYEPANLVTISTRYAYQDNRITEEANNAYVSMWNAASESGFKLIVNSSYRNYLDQEDVYDSIKNSKGQKNADKVAARPGYSEHQTGLAIDIFEIKNQSSQTFQDSEAYGWLKENAYLYGFTLRYPENKEYLTGYSFEAWHFRYVGVQAAKVIHEENITYDEYYAYYLENQES